MILGIDASNLRRGGGITHLVEVLKAAKPQDYGFTKVIVWSGSSTLDQIKDKPWLIKCYQPLLDKNLVFRAYWQRFHLSKLARVESCDLLLVPGGSYAGSFEPMVTMSRNMLPFEWTELRRYGLSILTIKWLILRWVQSKTFRRAKGVIFLTQFAKDAVTQVTGSLQGQIIVIPHGMNKQFIKAPKESRKIEHCSFNKPIRMLYVSIIDQYKHQWNVAKAVAELRDSGFPLSLDLVGPSYKPALKRLFSVTKEVDPKNNFIHYSGAVKHSELNSYYHNAELFIFASSCENMPNILLEGMASGLPIISSDRGPMPEVLGDAGIYFDPENIDTIKEAIIKMIKSHSLRDTKAKASFELAQDFSWSCCANKTFDFLSKIGLNHK